MTTAWNIVIGVIAIKPVHKTTTNATTHAMSMMTKIYAIGARMPRVIAEPTKKIINAIIFVQRVVV